LLSISKRIGDSDHNYIGDFNSLCEGWLPQLEYLWVLFYLGEDKNKFLDSSFPAKLSENSLKTLSTFSITSDIQKGKFSIQRLIEKSLKRKWEDISIS
jgi:hypothetical protein